MSYKIIGSNNGGTDGVISVGTLPFPYANAFTISLWAKGQNVDGFAIYWFYQTDGGDNGFFVVTNNSPSNYIGGGFTKTGTNGSINDGVNPGNDVWFHYAVCGDGSNTKHFKNGIQTGSTFVGDARVNVNGNTKRIGNYNTGISPPFGDVWYAEYALWDGLRADEAVDAQGRTVLSGLARGVRPSSYQDRGGILVNYWPMVSDLNDLGTRGENGTATSANPDSDHPPMIDLYKMRSPTIQVRPSIFMPGIAR